MKRVLLITYCWPPDASVGANRPAKLAQYLAQDGWQSTVVTVRERYYPTVNTTGGGTNQAVVLRSGMIRNPTAWYGSIKSLFYSLIGKQNQFRERVLSWTPGTTANVSRESMLARLKRIVLSLLHTPDEYQGWLPFATLTALRAVWTNRIQCLVSTGPPFSAHLVGLTVKALCGVPWVADFRDPWRSNDQKPAILRSRFADTLDRWLEAMVIRAADRVVCVTPAMTEEYRRRYSRQPSEKWLTITNGFDAEEFRQLGDIPRARKFTISYVGNLFYARSPETLLQVIADLLGDGTVDRQDIAVRFVGNCRYAGGRSVSDMIQSSGLEDVAEIVDAMPRRDALKEMMRSHVLLLLANEQRLQIPGKTFEYIAAGAHILALAEPGATADLISGIEGSAVCEISDLNGMKQVIGGWYQEFKRDSLRDSNHRAWDSTAVRKYEWRDLARVYATTLDQCLANRERPLGVTPRNSGEGIVTSDVRN